jgi:type II secretory pathway predicted ATPase ExeA
LKEESALNQLTSLSKEFLSYWSLERPVFGEEWDNSPCYIPQEHDALHKRVQLYCERKGSLIAVTAPAGHGKTTFAKWLYTSLDIERHEVLLLSLYKTENRAGWLLPRIAEFLGVYDAVLPPSMPELIKSVGDALAELVAESKQLTIIIDEANKLTTLESFDEVHALISAQCSIDVGINIILLGTPDLSETLKKLSSINNRVILQATYDLLSYEETVQYIAFRMQKAGLEAAVFTAEAVKRIWDYSEGNYSLINSICDNAMLECFFMRVKEIPAEVIDQAIEFIPALEGRRRSQMQQPALQVAGDSFVSSEPPPTELQAEAVIMQIAKAAPVKKATPQEEKVTDKPETANKEESPSPLKKSITLTSLFFDNDDDT